MGANFTRLTKTWLIVNERSDRPHGNIALKVLANVSRTTTTTEKTGYRYKRERFARSKNTVFPTP